MSPTSGSEWPAEDLERVETCPVCTGARRVLLYEGLTDRDYRCAPGTWSLWRCDECESAYLDPRPTRESLHLAYANYYAGASAPEANLGGGGSRLRRGRSAIRNGYLNARYACTLTPATQLGRLIMPLLPRHRERADRSVMYLRRPSPQPLLLDVGCGEGRFLLNMRLAGWGVTGIDPSPDAVSLAREVGLEAHAVALEPGLFEPASFDAVVLTRVLELFPDPHAALSICRDILRPGGFIALATPNLHSQGHARFGRDWLLLSPPRSLALFTPSSLAQTLKRVGFEGVAFHPAQTSSWTFRLSAALAAGREPFRKPPPLSPRLRLAASIADLRAASDAKVGEELICLARLPR